jgi:hypothetical protein
MTRHFTNKMKSNRLFSDRDNIGIEPNTDFNQTPKQKISLESNGELVPHTNSRLGIYHILLF